MSILDAVLRSPEQIRQHPLVRWLKERLAASDDFRVELQEDSSPLGNSVTGFCVLRDRKEQEQPPQFYDWDDDLNAALIDLGIKAIDLQQEGLRYSLVLRSSLRKVERRYGDGFLNAVLIELIDESDLSKSDEIKEVRKQIVVNKPFRGQGQSIEDCRNMIAAEIGGCAQDLKDKLQYTSTEARMIMEKAIAQYLDERFSITSQRQLGLISANGHTTNGYHY